MHVPPDALWKPRSQLSIVVGLKLSALRVQATKEWQTYVRVVLSTEFQDGLAACLLLRQLKDVLHAYQSHLQHDLSSAIGCRCWVACRLRLLRCGGCTI